MFLAHLLGDGVYTGVAMYKSQAGDRTKAEVIHNGNCDDRSDMSPLPRFGTCAKTARKGMCNV